MKKKCFHETVFKWDLGRLLVIHKIPENFGLILLKFPHQPQFIAEDPI